MDTPTSGCINDAAPQQPADDDGRRYLVAGLHADRPAVMVCGSAELARRLVEADRLGDVVAFRQLDGSTAETSAGTDAAAGR